MTKRKPVPPFPEKIPRHLGKKRNRVKIPKTPFVVDTIPIDQEFYSYKITSTAKGIGLKECRVEGRHSPVRCSYTYWYGRPGYPEELRRKDSWLIYCKRCANLLGSYVEGEGNKEMML